MPDPVGGTSGAKQIRTGLGAVEGEPAPNHYQQPDCDVSQPVIKPIGYPQPPDDLKFSEAVQQEVARAAIPFHEAIDHLSQQIDELQHHIAAQHQHIGQLQSETSSNRTADGDSPGIMKKLSWAVKNCFVKPVAGLVCAGLAVGALALMVTPVGLPALLVLGTLLQAAVPILVGFALGAGLIHSIYANDQTNNPADQEVRPHEPDELNDPEDKTKEDELEPPLEEFEPDTKPIQPKKIVTGYPQGKHALST